MTIMCGHEAWHPISLKLKQGTQNSLDTYDVFSERPLVSAQMSL
jgi:hypothetical protein